MQHTQRDYIWATALQLRTDYTNPDEGFTARDIAKELEGKDVDVTLRTVRDCLQTMADLGYLTVESRGGRKQNMYAGPEATEQQN